MNFMWKSDWGSEHKKKGNRNLISKSHTYKKFQRIWRLSIIKKDRQYTYKRNIDARLSDQCCRGKALSITYCVCV